MKKGTPVAKMGDEVVTPPDPPPVEVEYLFPFLSKMFWDWMYVAAVRFVEETLVIFAVADWR